ncbi:hypothetical protein TNCV_2781161 [Trichonephila clavipes]|nr:hypothetical protein TNCV_2781161 [Trichonephila clavipes]
MDSCSSLKVVSTLYRFHRSENVNQDMSNKRLNNGKDAQTVCEFTLRSSYQHVLLSVNERKLEGNSNGTGFKLVTRSATIRYLDHSTAAATASERTKTKITASRLPMLSIEHFLPSFRSGSTAQDGPWPSQEAFSRPAFFLPVFSSP